MAEIKEVIIIGSGPAGYTAAVYTARANLDPLMISGQTPGGQLTTTTEVENYPGFIEGIMGPDLMENMKKQAERFGTEIINSYVTEVDFSESLFKIKTASDEYLSKSVIIATGANPRFLGIEGERELMGFGVSTCATCDGAFFREQVISVAGGGDSACEEASFLSKFGSKIYLLHRREELRASKIMQERVFNNPKIEVLWNTEVLRVNGTKKDGVNNLLVKNNKTNEESELSTNALFIAIGHTPTSEIFKDKVSLDDNGYIVTEPDSSVTNIPGVFACGDVVDHVYRQAITAAGSGCMAAIDAERWLETT